MTETRIYAIAGESELAIPVVVLGEYLFGIRHSRHRLRYEDWLRVHIRAFLPLEIGLETAAHYAELRAELRAARTPIPVTTSGLRPSYGSTITGC